MNDLGRKLSLEEVAQLFEVSSATLLRYPHRYGGVRVGRRVYFFDQLIAEKVRKDYAIQEGEEQQDSLVRFGDAVWGEEGTGVRHQKGGPGMGSGNAPLVQGPDADPFDLVAGLGDKIS
ncbi:MAG: hypothetical protein AB7E47_06360 [Desulfovibrionaceae bacterium]